MTIIDLTIESGVSFRVSFDWKNPDGTPVFLSGYSAKMQIRPNPTSSIIYCTLSTNPTEGQGTIEIDSVTSSFKVHIPDEVTATFAWHYGTYDILAIAPNAPDGDVELVVKGRVTVSKTTTKLN